MIEIVTAEGETFPVYIRYFGDDDEKCVTYHIVFDGDFIKFNSECTKEIWKDLCGVVGLDPYKELENIITAEAKKELEALIKARNT